MGRQIIAKSSKHTHLAGEQNEHEHEYEESYVYDDDKARVVTFTGAVEEGSSHAITHRLIQLSMTSPDPIKLIINTPGGVGYEMFAIYDTIRYLRCPVHTIGLGKIMSAGVPILACGEKGHRVIGRNAVVMIHNMYAWIEGDPFALQNEHDHFKMISESFIRSLVENTKITDEELREMLSKRVDLYVGAEKAVELGIVDRIV